MQDKTVQIIVCKMQKMQEKKKKKTPYNNPINYKKYLNG